MNISIGEFAGYLAFMIGIVSYFVHTQTKMKIVFGMSSTVWSVHYWFLNAYTSSIIQVILTFRSWTSIFTKTKTQKHALFYFIFTAISFITCYSWDGWRSLIPFFASVNSTYAFCYADNQRMRKIMLFTSFLWLANGIVWNSFPQVITEVIKITANLYNLYQLEKNDEEIHLAEEIIEEISHDEITAVKSSSIIPIK